MLTSIYSIAYLLSLTGLVLWFFYEQKPKIARLMSTLFLGAFVAYAFSLAFAPVEFSTKLWVLFRDMMVLGAASQVFIWVKRSQWTFFALLLLTYGVYFAFYKSYAAQSLAMPQIELDENAELLVSLKDNSQLASLENWLSENLDEAATMNSAFNITPSESYSLDEYYTIDLPPSNGAHLKKIIKQLKALDFVLDAEQNEKIYVKPLESEIQSSAALNFSNDPNLNQQWSYDPMEISKVHALLKNIKPLNGPAKIAILDSGVDKNHEDLKSIFYSIDSKSNSDPVGHGTHCAGVAAAISNNGIGISSMAPNNQFVKITSVKTLSLLGGTQKTVIEGMIKAADSGVDVISMSLGGMSTDTRQLAFAEAVEYANSKGAIVVAAAGNSNADAVNYSPANVPGVIAVGAVNQSLSKASFSNTVDNLEMGISAPGKDIFSTFPKNKYKTYSGTSMACPQVAGLIGIMRAINPDLTTREVYNLLKETAKKGDKYEKVGPMIQPFEALKALVD